MAFNRKEVSYLLAICHRRCCICHRFCGTKIETDHIVQEADSGSNDIENAIPVCFECHAEIHSYNPKHPRGRKFQPEELQKHKEQWLEICKEQPEIFVSASWKSDVGPLQALIDELEFNEVVAQTPGMYELGCPFHDKQFRRAINEGSISILVDDLKSIILKAYAAMGRFNQLMYAALNQASTGARKERLADAQTTITNATPAIEEAKDKLLAFLGTEKDQE